MKMRFNTQDAFMQSMEESIQKNVSLAAYNTFRFAYHVEYFAIAETLDSSRHHDRRW